MYHSIKQDHKGVRDKAAEVNAKKVYIENDENLFPSIFEAAASLVRVLKMEAICSSETSTRTHIVTCQKIVLSGAVSPVFCTNPASTRVRYLLLI
jgi:hypothetical protein